MALLLWLYFYTDTEERQVVPIMPSTGMAYEPASIRSSNGTGRHLCELLFAGEVFASWAL